MSDEQKLIVTFDDFTKCGINCEEINTFINCGIINYLSENTFSINSIESLIWSINSKNLMPIIVNYLSNNNNELTIVFNKFLNSILNDDNVTCFVYLDVLLAMSESKYSDKINYYLYLLCVINDNLPGQYYEYIKKVSKKIPNQYFYNQFSGASKSQIYAMIYEHKFVAAYRLMEHQDINTLEDKVISYLLSQAINVKNNGKKHVIDLINKEQYVEVAKHYIKKARHYRLSTVANYIVKLCDILNLILTYKIIPKPYKKGSKNIFDAIKYGDFTVAYFHAQQYLKTNNHEESSDILYQLLLKMNQIISEININNVGLEELEYNGLVPIKSRIESKNYKKACDYLHPYLERNNKLMFEKDIKYLIEEYVENNNGTVSDIMEYIICIMTQEIQPATFEEILNFVPDNFDIPESKPYVFCKRSA